MTETPETPETLNTLEDICAALADVPARVDLIVHLRSMVIDWGANTAVEDLFTDEMTDAQLKNLLPQVSKADRAAMLSGDMETVQMAVDDLKLFGFIVQISTPLVSKQGSYSWGTYTHHLFYADTFDNALRAGLAWARETHEDRSR